METEILNYVSDMDNFIAENWDHFLEYMNAMGISEEDVNKDASRLTEYLTDEGYS